MWLDKCQLTLGGFLLVAVGINTTQSVLVSDFGVFGGVILGRCNAFAKEVSIFVYLSPTQQVPHGVQTTPPGPVAGWF